MDVALPHLSPLSDQFGDAWSVQSGSAGAAACNMRSFPLWPWLTPFPVLPITTCMYHIGAGSPTWGPGPSREAFVCTSEGTDQDVRAFWCGNVCSVAYPPRAYFLSDVPLSPKPRRGFCHLAEGVVFPWAFAYVASSLPFQNHPQHLLMQVSLHVFLSYACVLYSSSPLMGTMEFTLPVYDFTAPSSFKEWCQ